MLEEIREKLGSNIHDEDSVLKIGFKTLLNAFSVLHLSASIGAATGAFLGSLVVDALEYKKKIDKIDSNLKGKTQGIVDKVKNIKKLFQKREMDVYEKYAHKNKESRKEVLITNKSRELLLDKLKEKGISVESREVRGGTSDSFKINGVEYEIAEGELHVLNTSDNFGFSYNENLTDINLGFLAKQLKDDSIAGLAKPKDQIKNRTLEGRRGAVTVSDLDD